jgi:hypothetical protein
MTHEQSGEQEGTDLNEYFLLELRIPRTHIKFLERKLASKCHDYGKINLVNKLEVIFGKDLISDNPFMNPSATRTGWLEPPKNHVKFRHNEISSEPPDLPHCWRLPGTKVIRPGHLHTIQCPNFWQETIHNFDQRVWLNRVNILNDHFSHTDKVYVPYDCQEQAHQKEQIDQGPNSQTANHMESSYAPETYVKPNRNEGQSKIFGDEKSHENNSNINASESDVNFEITNSSIIHGIDEDTLDQLLNLDKVDFNYQSNILEACMNGEKLEVESSSDESSIDLSEFLD